jgi:putative thioredoxin
MTQQPGSAPGPRLNLRGAVDLSSLTQRSAPGQPAGPAGAGTGSGGDVASGVVVDVTDATFGDTVQRSMTVPVVVDLRSSRSPASQQLSTDLKALAAEYSGRFLLAEVDVDASPQIAQAFQVQSIPSVVAVIKGQPVPLFQGAYPADQLRQVLDELLRVAAENGVTGRLDVAEAPEQDAAAAPEEPPLPPLHAEAYDAIERDDLDAAADAYRRAITQNPADADAKAGLAQVELMLRTRGADAEAARAAAAADPQDVDAQLLAADLDVMGGHVDDAFGRLVDTVRVTSGDDRDRVRLHLVELFEVVGTDDDRVVSARRALASALF